MTWGPGGGNVPSAGALCLLEEEPWGRPIVDRRSCAPSLGRWPSSPLQARVTACTLALTRLAEEEHVSSALRPSNLPPTLSNRTPTQVNAFPASNPTDLMYHMRTKDLWDLADRMASGTFEAESSLRRLR